MSEDETIPLPGEEMIAEAPEIPTVPAWSRARVDIRKSKAEVVTREVTAHEAAEYRARFGADAVTVLEVLA